MQKSQKLFEKKKLNLALEILQNPDKYLIVDEDKYINPKDIYHYILTYNLPEI